MVIWKKDCPILKELNEALKTISEYSITAKEKEECIKHFSIVKSYCEYGCSRSLVSQLVATRFFNSCSVINALPIIYVLYGKDKHNRIFTIYEDNGGIRVEVG